MSNFIIHLLVSAALLFVVGRIVRDFHVRGAKAAVFGALALAAANWLVTPLLLLLTLPITILTLGLFVFVVNAVVLKLASMLVSGFDIRTARAALFGALIFAGLNFLVRQFFG